MDALSEARIRTVIRRLKRAPVSRRTADAAIELLDAYRLLLASLRETPKLNIPREDDDLGGDHDVTQEDDVIVNADRKVANAKRA